MRSNINTIIVVLLFSSTRLLMAQEPPALDVDCPGLDMNVEADRILIAFCQGALLRERGLTCTPFTGGTDKWILESLLRKPGFVETLDATPLPPSFAELGISPLEGKHKMREDVLSIYQKRNKYYDKIVETLKGNQRKKLPMVYLHTEGLMALCRPEFASLFERPETQSAIGQLTTETWSTQASEIHRALFGLQSFDIAPPLELQLRKVSYRLDCRIIGLLSKAERKQLSDLLSSTRGIGRAAYGAPAY